MAWIGCPSCSKSVQDTATVCPHCGAALKGASAAASAVVPTGPQIPCEKCKTGTMWSTKVPKYSEGLRLIGFTLWVPSILLLAGATVIFAITIITAGTATTTTALGDLKPLHARLEQVSGLSPSFIEAARDGTITDEEWNLVADDAKPRAREVVEQYDAEVRVRSAATAGGVIGTGLVTGVGGCGLVVIYFILVPLFIIGLVLTTKRSVWKCTQCGYVYDRA